jgi:hypothetical protein
MHRALPELILGRGEVFRLPCFPGLGRGGLPTGVVGFVLGLSFYFGDRFCAGFRRSRESLFGPML